MAAFRNHFCIQRHSGRRFAQRMVANSTCVADVQAKVGQSQEISSITAAHVSWVNDLNDHLVKGSEFTGSLTQPPVLSAAGSQRWTKA
jgi:hypothetical protein